MNIPSREQTQMALKSGFYCFCWVNCVFHLNSITTSNDSFLGDPALFKRSYVHVFVYNCE